MSNLAIDHTLALPGPDDITRAVLPNGIIVLARQNKFSPSVTIGGYIQAGGLHDPDEKLGLADFVAEALMRGTQARTFKQIYGALESVGASLGFDSGVHVTGFGGRGLAEDLGMLLEVLADVLRSPVFPVKDVERLRAQLLTGLAMREQSTSARASMEFDRLVYENHPYSRPEDGYPETIQAITREDLISFHKNVYGPKGMVIAVVGAVDPEAAVDAVRRHLVDWQNPAQGSILELPGLSPMTERRTADITIPGKSQTDIVLGVAGPPRSSPDYVPAVLGNNILGVFGMMGRLGRVVREQAGLAYSVSSNLGGGLGPSPWQVSAGVDPVNKEKAVDLILQEIRRFVDEPVTEQELADNQSSFIGSLPLSLESNAGVAGALLSLERYQLGLDYYRQYPNMVRQVTVDDVQQAARHYLDPETMCIVSAGPELKV